jgi:hypothetical protein
MKMSRLLLSRKDSVPAGSLSRVVGAPGEDPFPAGSTVYPRHRPGPWAPFWERATAE